MFKQTDAKITQYQEGDFLLYIVEADDKYEAWLQHRSYGVSSIVIGLDKNRPGLPPLTKETFLNEIAGEISEHSEFYTSEYMDKEETEEDEEDPSCGAFDEDNDLFRVTIEGNGCRPLSFGSEMVLVAGVDCDEEDGVFKNQVAKAGVHSVPEYLHLVGSCNAVAVEELAGNDPYLQKQVIKAIRRKTKDILSSRVYDEDDL